MPFSWPSLAAFLRPDQVVLLAAQVAPDASTPESILLQQGPIGALLLLALAILWVLLRREMARADRTEAELGALNKLIREEFVPSLTRNSDALMRAIDLLEDMRREERKGR